MAAESTEIVLLAAGRPRTRKAGRTRLPGAPGLLAAVLACAVAAPVAAAPCAGDCNRDRMVALGEIDRLVHAAFGGDDCGGTVRARDLLRAGRNLVAGCGVWRFRDLTAGAGIDVVHAYDTDRLRNDLDAQSALDTGGVAAGDYDGDGWVDLYVVAGDLGTNRLLRNIGGARFEDRAADAGVALAGELSSGPTFADLDGDGDLDLFVGGVVRSPARLYRNLGGGRFAEATATSGIEVADNAVGAAFGDYDGDGLLDLALARWGAIATGRRVDYLWRNLGDLVFAPATESAGLAGFRRVLCELDTFCDTTFTPTFADLDDDGDLDLLFAGDFGGSRVFRNLGGRFENATSGVISDENGMGSAVGDYDNDGDLDWFVSSIFDPDGVAEGTWGITGNRLYRNRDGVFEDATDEAGVRHGFWGWGSCFADFDNDGWLDLLHVNGFQLSGAQEFHRDPTRLFVGSEGGVFTERAAELGLDDDDQGRGVVCFDYDRDGDVDLFIHNNGQAARLYRNEGGNQLHYLRVRLEGRPPNTEGVGARVEVTSGGRTQMRELQAGSNFVSQNPVVAHFGLGEAEAVEHLHIRWPGGGETVLGRLEVDREIVVRQPP